MGGNQSNNEPRPIEVQNPQPPPPHKKTSKELFILHNPEYRKKERVHFSIVLGFTSNGKDTFIFNLDNELLHLKHNNMPVLRFGDSVNSTTFEPLEMSYKNNKILKNYNGGRLLNTVGLSDGQAEKEKIEFSTPTTFVFKLLNHLYENHGSVKGYIDTIFVVCSVTDENNISRYDDMFKNMMKAFGPSIFGSVIFILNKANLLNNKEATIEPFKQLAKKFFINHIIELQGNYFYKGNKHMMKETGPNQHNVFMSEIEKAIDEIVPFDFSEASSFHRTKIEDLEKIKSTIESQKFQSQQDLSCLVHIKNIMNVLEPNLKQK